MGNSTAQQTRVLVTGATGALGPRVVQALQDVGYLVCTLSLDAPQPGMFPGGVEVITGDVTNPSTVRATVCGVQTVIHMAALLHIVNPVPAIRARYEKINVGGTITVVEAALQAGVQRLVLFSTIAVYGNSADKILDEDNAPEPDTLYARTKLAAERIVLEAKRQDGQSLGTVLRLGAAYGSHVKGNYHRLLQSLARGWFIPVGNGRNRRTLVYDKDAARAAVLAMYHPAAAGRVYNVSDGRFPTLNELIKVMCVALGRTPPHVSLPVLPVRLAAGALEDVARLVGRQSFIERATIDKYTEDVAVSSQRIQTELGFVPQFDLATGWRETVSEMRRRGEL